MNELNSSREDQTITLVGAHSGGVRARGERDLVERSVGVVQMRQNFEKFLEGLEAIIDVEIPTVGVFELDEVQFNAEISANGEFKLLGAGVGLEASSGVTFTLRRK